MGWLFIGIGVFLAGIGTFLGIYGQQLLTEKPPTPTPGATEQILSPPQLRLLTLLFRYQQEFAASKLIIARENGELFFDEPERHKAVKVNFLTELYGSKTGDVSKAPEFVSLMESLPTEYVRFYPENRWGGPFVISVTTEGIRYLQPHNRAN